MHKGQGADIIIMALEGLYSPEYTLANLRDVGDFTAYSISELCLLWYKTDVMITYVKLILA